MNLKRIAAAAVAATGFGLVVAPGIAEAHQSTVSANCETGLTVSVTNYFEGVTTKVTIDGSRVDTIEGDFQETYPLGSPSVSHTYVVDIDGHGDTLYDTVYQDTVEACTPPTTAPPTTAPPTTAATTTTTAAATPTTAAATTTTIGQVAGASGTSVQVTTTTIGQVAGVSGTAAELPATGSASGVTAAIGAALIAAGGALWLAARRPRTS